MKILMLCLRSPYPPSDGGTIAMYNMALALKKANAMVKIVAFNTRKHLVDPATIPGTFVSDFEPQMVYLDASVRIIPAMINLFGGGSYNVNRFNSPLMHDALVELLELEQFDFILLESLFMTPYLGTIRKKSGAKIVLRAHNVEFQIWQRLAEAAQNPFKKWYLRFLSHRLKKYETAIINQLDGIVALTEEDKNLFGTLGCRVPVLVSPIGLDTGNYPVNNQPAKNISIVHLGSMDWLPNIEGVDWFLDRVFPSLKERLPGTNIYLAGKNMPQRIFDLANEHFIVNGRIDDARHFLADKQIMIVPLLSGGGMRVKIIEGLAMGKTIISTTIGAEGIRCTDRQNIIIADTAEAFCDAIVQCVTNPDFASRIGREARLLAEKVYENKIIGSGIIAFFNSLSPSIENYSARN